MIIELSLLLREAAYLVHFASLLAYIAKSCLSKMSIFTGIFMLTLRMNVTNRKLMFRTLPKDLRRPSSNELTLTTLSPSFLGHCEWINNKSGDAGLSTSC